MLILHDYGSGLWPGIKKAADEYFATRREVPVYIAISGSDIPEGSIREKVRETKEALPQG